MSDYNTFDLNVQCEESNEVSAEEMAEVFEMMAAEAEGLSGFGEWSAEVGQEKNWLGSYTNRLPGPKAGAFDI